MIDFSMPGEKNRTAYRLPPLCRQSVFASMWICVTCAVQLPYEHLDGEDKNPTDPDVIETVCYSSELDVSLKDSLHGVGSSSRVDRLFTYFGSWNGVMRTFPGASYDNKCGEYDPRIRPWYVAASSGPKDVVIVLDISNSMRRNGFFDVAKDAVQSVLDTMNEFTFVNVVTFNTNVRSVSPLSLINIDVLPSWCDHIRPR